MCEFITKTIVTQKIEFLTTRRNLSEGGKYKFLYIFVKAVIFTRIIIAAVVGD